MDQTQEPHAQPVEQTAVQPTQTEPAKPIALTVTVPNSKGAGTRQLQKDPKTGRFLKSVRNDAKLGGLARTRRAREFLLSKDEEIGNTIEQNINTSLYRLTQNFGPKEASAAVKAAELLFTTAFGKPSTSDEELNAMEKSGVKVVVLPYPVDMPHPEIIDGDKPKPTPKPRFIDAEVISTDEPEGKDIT